MLTDFFKNKKDSNSPIARQTSYAMPLQPFPVDRSVTPFKGTPKQSIGTLINEAMYHAFQNVFVQVPVEVTIDAVNNSATTSVKINGLKVPPSLHANYATAYDRMTQMSRTMTAENIASSAFSQAVALMKDLSSVSHICQLYRGVVRAYPAAKSFSFSEKDVEEPDTATTKFGKDTTLIISLPLLVSEIEALVKIWADNSKDDAVTKVNVSKSVPKFDSAIDFTLESESFEAILTQGDQNESRDKRSVLRSISIVIALYQAVDMTEGLTKMMKGLTHQGLITPLISEVSTFSEGATHFSNLTVDDILLLPFMMNEVEKLNSHNRQLSEYKQQYQNIAAHPAVRGIEKMTKAKFSSVTSSDAFTLADVMVDLGIEDNAFKENLSGDAKPLAGSIRRTFEEIVPRNAYFRKVSVPAYLQRLTTEELFVAYRAIYSLLVGARDTSLGRERTRFTHLTKASVDQVFRMQASQLDKKFEFSPLRYGMELSAIQRLDTAAMEDFVVTIFKSILIASIMQDEPATFTASLTAGWSQRFNRDQSELDLLGTTAASLATAYDAFCRTFAYIEHMLQVSIAHNNPILDPLVYDAIVNDFAALKNMYDAVSNQMIGSQKYSNYTAVTGNGKANSDFLKHLYSLKNTHSTSEITVVPKIDTTPYSGATVIVKDEASNRIKSAVRNHVFAWQSSAISDVGGIYTLLSHFPDLYEMKTDAILEFLHFSGAERLIVRHRNTSELQANLRMGRYVQAIKGKHVTEYLKKFTMKYPAYANLGVELMSQLGSVVLGSTLVQQMARNTPNEFVGMLQMIERGVMAHIAEDEAYFVPHLAGHIVELLEAPPYYEDYVVPLSDHLVSSNLKSYSIPYPSVVEVSQDMTPYIPTFTAQVTLTHTMKDNKVNNSDPAVVTRGLGDPIQTLNSKGGNAKTTMPFQQSKGKGSPSANPDGKDSKDNRKGGKPTKPVSQTGEEEDELQDEDTAAPPKGKNGITSKGAGFYNKPGGR